MQTDPLNIKPIKYSLHALYYLVIVCSAIVISSTVYSQEYLVALWISICSFYIFSKGNYIINSIIEDQIIVYVFSSFSKFDLSKLDSVKHFSDQNTIHLFSVYSDTFRTGISSFVKNSEIFYIVTSVNPLSEDIEKIIPKVCTRLFAFNTPEKIVFLKPEDKDGDQKKTTDKK